MEQHGHGVDLLTSISLRAICLVCFAFVDDTDLVISGRDQFTKGEDIKEEFQIALDRCASGLIATRGALAPAKSFCYMSDFEWTGKDWKYRSMADMPGEFNLLMGDGTREPLQRHEVDYAEKTLGVFVSMDGNENAENKYLREKSVTFANQMKTSKANKNSGMYTYTASSMKTMEYPMVVTQFSEAE